jgi:hypothetical protein
LYGAPRANQFAAGLHHRIDNIVAHKGGCAFDGIDRFLRVLNDRLDLVLQQSYQSPHLPDQNPQQRADDNRLDRDYDDCYITNGCADHCRTPE